MAESGRFGVTAGLVGTNSTAKADGDCRRPPGWCSSEAGTIRNEGSVGGQAKPLNGRWPASGGRRRRGVFGEVVFEGGKIGEADGLWRYGIGGQAEVVEDAGNDSGLGDKGDEG